MSFVVLITILILIVCLIWCFISATDNQSSSYLMMFSNPRSYMYPRTMRQSQSNMFRKTTSNNYPYQRYKFYNSPFFTSELESDSESEFESELELNSCRNNTILQIQDVEQYEDDEQYNMENNLDYDINENFNDNNKYKFCIMAIFKNEENYLEEWIIHHKKQGITHVYLYAHDPELEKYPYLSKYKDWITLIPWSHKKNQGLRTIQRQAYEDCVKTYDGEYNFIMMLDIDEFLISKIPNQKVIDFIDKVDENTKAIKVPRYDFGPNGHINKPQGNVMDNYKKHEKICSSYKTIANTDYLDKNKYFYGVHDFPFTTKPGKIYNEYLNYKLLGYPRGCEKNRISEIPLVINHYYAKSREEYLKRCEMWKSGGVNYFGARKDCANKFNSLNIDVVKGYDYLNE